MAGTRFDAGWNCRDHALIVGLLLASFDHSVVLAHGEGLFVRGPRGQQPGTSYLQRPHNWLVVDGLGPVDLSIKPSFDCAGDVYRLPLSGVFGGAWLPRGRGRAYFLTDPDAFARAERELPERRNHASAVYLTVEHEHLHAGHVDCSAGWCASILTDYLDKAFGEPRVAYAALFLHLRDVLLGQAPSLAGESFDAAWRDVVAAHPSSVDQAMAHLEPHLATPPEAPASASRPRPSRA